MSGGRVLVVGSINVDLVVAVERLPVEGETVAGGRFSRHGGGKGANQAVAAARAGAHVALLGAVGDDEHGRAALAELAAEGVDVGAVARVDAPTGVAAIVVDVHGANQIAVASGANALVDDALVRAALGGRRAAPRAAAPVDAALAGGADAASDAEPAAAYDVLLVNHELSDDANAPAIDDAVARAARVVVNPAPARPLTDEVLAAAPILTPNRDEALALAPGAADVPRAAHALGQRTGAPVVVTLGRDGALIVDPDGAAEPVPAPRVRAVDTTGAGDVLSGTLAAALAAGAPLLAAVEHAVAAAAESVTKPGARGR